MRMRALEVGDEVIVERRDFAVLFRRQALQPCHARVDDEVGGPCPGLRFDEREEACAWVVIIDAEAVFHGDRHVDRLAHGGEAVGNEVGLAHKAGAERARLHALRRAADVEIDFAIAVGGADAGGLCELLGLRAAELQGDGLLQVVEPQQPVTITMDDSVGRDHLGIEQRVAGQMAVESPAIPVRPVHHRRDAEPMRLSFHRKYRSIRALDRVTVSQCSLMVPPVSGCFRFECDPSVTRIG